MIQFIRHNIFIKLKNSWDFEFFSWMYRVWLAGIQDEIAHIYRHVLRYKSDMLCVIIMPTVL